MLEYILEYLEDVDSRSKLEVRKTMMSLTSIFSFIIKKTNPKLHRRLLALCCQKPDSEFPLPKFGTSGVNYTFAKVPVVDRKISKRIYEPGQDQLTFTTTLTHLDYDPTSNDMLALISTLKHVRDEEVFKSSIVAKVIDHFWRTSKNVFRVCMFFYSAFMVIFSVYIGLGERNLGLEITIICLAALLTLGVGLQLYTLRSYYYYDPWNVADTLENTLTFIFIGLKLGSTNKHIRELINDENGILAQEWLASLIILIGYMRWVSYLRYFKSTRNLIQTIISIMRDMYGFIIILVFIFVGFSLIFLEFDRNQVYGNQLYATYQVLYGNINDGNFSVSQKLFAMLILFLLNVVLLNLLISIMGDTYGKVQERRVLTDSLTRLDLISDAIPYMRVFTTRREQKKGYLIYCESEVIGLEDDSDKDEWEGQINIIKRKLEETKGEVKRELTTMKQNVTSMEQEVRSMREEMLLMKEGIVSMEQRIQHEIGKNQKEMMQAINSSKLH